MKSNYQRIFGAFTLPALLLQPTAGEWFIKDANKNFCELIGKDIREVKNKNIRLLFPADKRNQDWRIERSTLQRVLESKKEEVFPYLRFDRQNPITGEPEEKYWKVAYQPIFNDNGTVQYVLHTAMDRTTEVIKEKEKQQLQQELKRMRSEQRQFINLNPDGLFCLDCEGRFKTVSPGMTGMAEIPEEQLLQEKLFVFCLENREQVLYFFQKALAGESQHFETVFLCGNGHKKILKITLRPEETEGEVKEVYGISRDITAERETERVIHQKEEEIQRVNQKFQMLVESSSDLVGIIDDKGTYKYVSNTTSSVLGVRPEDYLGKSPLEFIHPEDVERVSEVINTIEEGKKMRLEAFRFKDGYGNWRWMETTVTNMLNDPIMEGLVVNSREVTEVVEKNKKIRELYERYSLAAAATGDLIYDWDLVADNVQRFFKGKEKQFGYERAEMEKRQFWRKQVHPEELPHLRERLKTTLADPSKNEIRSQYRFKRADGSYAHIIDRGMILRNENGEAVRLIGATSDISEIINRRDALRVANKRFSYAMKATQEMIWDWDIINNIIIRNKAFRKIYGYDSSQKASVENFWFNKIVLKDQERVRNSLNFALQDSGVIKWKEEYRFLKVNGEEAFVIDRGYILRDASGKAIRMVGATLDVTESRRMMKEIKKQNRILKEVAWEQAHIVRAPIARLKGLLDLLDDVSHEEWDREEILQLIKDSAEELDQVVRAIIRKTEDIGSQK